MSGLSVPERADAAGVWIFGVGLPDRNSRGPRRRCSAIASQGSASTRDPLISDQMTTAPRKRPLSPKARRALKLPASNSRGFTEGFALAAPRLGEREPGSLAGSRASQIRLEV